MKIDIMDLRAYGYRMHFQLKGEGAERVLYRIMQMSLFCLFFFIIWTSYSTEGGADCEFSVSAIFRDSTTPPPPPPPLNLFSLDP